MTSLDPRFLVEDLGRSGPDGDAGSAAALKGSIE
jgi:hypothetical protein